MKHILTTKEGAWHSRYFSHSLLGEQSATSRPVSQLVTSRRLLSAVLTLNMHPTNLTFVQPKMLKMML